MAFTVIMHTANTVFIQVRWFTHRYLEYQSLHNLVSVTLLSSIVILSVSPSDHVGFNLSSDRASSICIFISSVLCILYSKNIMVGFTGTGTLFMSHRASYVFIIYRIRIWYYLVFVLTHELPHIIVNKLGERV